MNSMKHWHLLILLGILLLQSACETDDETDVIGNWVERSDFEGHTRSSAVSFVIGDQVYVGSGYNGSDDEYYNDFWGYDPQLNFWQPIATFPGAGRSSAVAFGIGNKGYIGTGFDGDDELKDFWEYDPATNTWTQKADFGGTARREAVGFALNDRGYIGTGYDGSDTKDFWEYNPATNTWTQIPSIGGSKRRGGVAFVIDDKAYVGTGTHNGAYEFDFWELDGAKVHTDEFPWNEKEDLDADDDYNLVRSGAAAFSLNGKGYLVGGLQGSALNTVWEYDPVEDVWEQKTSLEGTSRDNAVGFEVQGRGFVTLGKNGSMYFDDIWELQPNEEYDEED